MRETSKLKRVNTKPRHSVAIGVTTLNAKERYVMNPDYIDFPFDTSTVLIFILYLRYLQNDIKTLARTKEDNRKLCELRTKRDEILNSLISH